MTTVLDKLSYHFESIKLAIYTLFVFLNMNLETVKILLIMIGIDTVLGLVKSIKLKGTFSFKVLLWGLVSKIMLLFFPMVVALAAKGVDYDLTAFPAVIMNILIVSEGFSAIGNIQTIRTGEKVENVDIVSLLINGTRALFLKVLKSGMRALGIEDNEQN